METQDKRHEFQIWWDEKNQIIRGKYWGDFDEDDVLECQAALTKIINHLPGRRPMLNDLSAAGSATARARRIFARMMREERITRRAFVGMKIATRVIVSFIQNFAGVQNVKFFDNEPEAIKWLQGS
jgi:hypothetical protein